MNAPVIDLLADMPATVPPVCAMQRSSVARASTLSSNAGQPQPVKQTCAPAISPASCPLVHRCVPAFHFVSPMFSIWRATSGGIKPARTESFAIVTNIFIAIASL